MKPARIRGFALAACLLGAIALLASVTQPWAEATVDHGAGAPLGSVSVTGSAVAGALTGLGLASLAAVAAVVAVRGLARRIVGVVVLVLGVAAIAASWHGRAPGTLTSAALASAPGATMRALGATPWSWVALLGALVVAVGGVAVLVGGAGSALTGRHESPGSAAARVADPWTALDRGDDPTV